MIYGKLSFGLYAVLRASEAVKQMEFSQRHEAEETSALEKMMQKVEANLEATTVMFLCLNYTCRLGQPLRVPGTRLLVGFLG